LAVTKKIAKFVRAKKKPQKGVPASAEQNIPRLTEHDRKAAIRAGRGGAAMMLFALVCSVVGLVIILINRTTMTKDEPEGRIPTVIQPLLAMMSTILLIGATFRWRKTAEAIELGLVVRIGLVIGPILLAINVLNVVGWAHEFFEALEFYLRVVYFTLLVAFLDRITILADRYDLHELAQRVLSWGIGVLVSLMLLEFLAVLGPLPLALLMFLLLVVFVISYAIWSFEYGRLLVYFTGL
jgi:hypothetical protein